MPNVIAVTGASGGIGRASAVAFAKRGDSVVLLGRGKRGLVGAAQEVEAAGGKAFPITVDVAQANELAAVVERIENEIGPIDVWVNVAFTSVFSPFDLIEPDEYRRVTEVSYLGYVYATMAVLKYMKRRNRGTIVQVGSALAYRGIPLQTAYCGAKHAIQGFHEALRCELLHEKSNVHVTMVQMPTVNTPEILLGVIPFTAPGQTGATDLPARVRSPRRVVCRRSPGAARVLGRHYDNGDAVRQRNYARCARPLPRSNRLQVTTNRAAEGPTRQPISGIRPMDPMARTMGHVGSSTRTLTTTTPSCGRRRTIASWPPSVWAWEHSAWLVS